MCNKCETAHSNEASEAYEANEASVTNEANEANNANSLISLDHLGTTSHKTVNVYCGHCGHTKQVKLKCNDRTCPECRKRIYGKLYKNWFSLVEGMKDPKLLTLTTLNVDELTKEHVKFIRTSFNRLMRRKYYRDRIKGGLYVIEIKNLGKGWNIHLHALIDTLPNREGFLIQKQISEDWLDITKHSKIVDIRQAKNPRYSLSYILKYLTKPPEINGEVVRYNAALEGTRLIQTFGELYSSHPEKKKIICEKCGNDWWMSEFSLVILIREANRDIKSIRLKRKDKNKLKKKRYWAARLEALIEMQRNITLQT